MSHLSEIYIKADTLKILADTVAKKGEKGIKITISTDDKQNEWGQNVSSHVSQSKEDREASKPKFYVGNGKVFWKNSDSIFIPKRDDAPAHSQATVIEDNDDLPF